DYRRPGLAQRLVETALERPAALKIASVELDAAREGQPPCEKLGFKTEQIVERWFHDGRRVDSPTKPFPGAGSDSERERSGCDRQSSPRKLRCICRWKGARMNKTIGKMNRRTFLNNTVQVVGGSAALGTNALSYGRIAGANDRISLGHIGIGSRGAELDEIASRLKQSHNVRMTAVCDLWSVNREKARAANAAFYGESPRTFKYLEEMLAAGDLDAVIISTPEHSHSPILKLAAEAGKDVYVEKPMGNVLAEVKAAREAVLRHKVIVQGGTQHRREPHPKAARDAIQSGALGDVSKIEIVWNYHGPRWRGRKEVTQIREADTDW